MPSWRLLSKHRVAPKTAAWSRSLRWSMAAFLIIDVFFGPVSARGNLKAACECLQSVSTNHAIHGRGRGRPNLHARAVHTRGWGTRHKFPAPSHVRCTRKLSSGTKGAQPLDEATCQHIHAGCTPSSRRALATWASRFAAVSVPDRTSLFLRRPASSTYVSSPSRPRLLIEATPGAPVHHVQLY